MRSKVVFIMILLFSVSALAFGGGGGGHGRVRKRYGTDSIGIHIDPDRPINAPIFGECDDPNAHYNEYGLCVCNDGYNNKDGKTCVIDACQGFVPSGCRTNCTSSGGQASYTECHGTGTCINNECEYEQHIDCNPECGECQKCDTSIGMCIADGDQEGLTCATHSVCEAGNCVCDTAAHWIDDGIGGCKCDTNYKEENGQCVPNACASFDPNANECITDCTSSGGEATYTYATLCHNGAWVCNPTSHVCENPCTGKTPSGCIENWNAVAGECVAQYYTADEHHSCDTNKECNGEHCVCVGYMKDSVCTTCPEHATCDGTNFTCTSGFEKVGEQCLAECGEHEIRDSENTCVCNNTQMWYGSTGNCQLCHTTGKIIIDNTCVCDASQHLVVDGDVCACDNTNMWYGQPGQCIHCTGEGVIYDGANACKCNTGYYGTGTQCTKCPEHGICTETEFVDCEEGYLKEDNICAVDACVELRNNFPDCLDTCTSHGSVITEVTYKTTCKGNTWSCNATTHLCEDPCDGQNPTGCVKKLMPIGGICSETEYQAVGYTCDTHKTCDNSHDCLCDTAGHWTAKGDGCVCEDDYLENEDVCGLCPEHSICHEGIITACTDGYMLNGEGVCVNLCDTTPYNTYCQTCTPNGEGVIIENHDGVCPDENEQNNWTCQNGSCVSPCTGKMASGCVQSWNAVAGSCVAEFQNEGYRCDPNNTNMECNTAHQCVCTGYMKDSVCTACPEHATCDGTTFTCDQDYLKEGDACVTDACVQLRQDYPDCLDTCTSSGGVPTATYKTTCGTDNNWSCNATTHLCENPCDGQTPTGCVKTLAPAAGVCSATEYQDEGYACDTNKQCNVSHECVCTGYMKDSVCTACPPNAVSCDGVDFTCPENWEKSDDDCLVQCLIDGAEENECILQYVSIDNQCQPIYKDSTYTCGTLTGENQHYCNGSGLCTCPGGKYEKADGTCFSCQTDGAETTAAECRQCPGNYYVAGKCFTVCSGNEWMEAKFDDDSSPTRHITSGVCHACDYSTPHTAVSEESCNACSGTRFMAPDMQGGPKCFYCGNTSVSMDMTKKDSDGNTIFPSEAYIASCNACLNRSFKNNKCICDSDKTYTTPEGKKACCPLGLIASASGTECVDDFGCDAGYLYNSDLKECVPCEQADGLVTTKRQCNSCGMIFTDGAICRTKPEEGYMMDNNGTVYACDSYIDNFGILDESYCNACPNRFYVDKHNRKDCYRCDTKESLKTTREDCEKCPNRSFDEETQICSCASELQTVTRPVYSWDVVNRVHTYVIQKTRICPY